MPQTITLTFDQQAAMNDILSFVDSREERVLILKGHAGTGKTTLVKKIITELQNQRRVFRLLAKVPLAVTGRCRHTGLLRNFLAEGDCAASVVSIVIPGYAGIWNFEL